MRDLQVNDVFSFTWAGESAVGIVTNLKDVQFSFDDVWMASGTLVNATTINYDDMHQEFRYGEFLFTFKPTSVQVQLKKKCPEYFL